MSKLIVPLDVKELYDYWNYFIDNKVSFNLKNSLIHTKVHEQRVLLYALLIADKIGTSSDEKIILCHASAFHDTRRHDDWYDIGHGRRGAEYYKSFCENSSTPFLPWAYNIMAYHDLNDSFGETAMYCEITGRELLLFKIFKDADALDRVRLGPNGLDPKYLRTKASFELIDFAKKNLN